MMLSRNGRNNSDGSFDWRDAVIDAGILSGMTFFSTLGGLAVVNLLSNPHAWVSALVAAGAQFFGVLAIKRGLRDKK